MKKQSREFPEGWEKTKLPNFCYLEMGQSPSSNTYNTDGVGLPFYQGKTEFGDIYPTPQKYCTEPNKIALEGDTLLSVRAPVGPTNLCPHRACVGRGLAAIRPQDSVSPKFVLFLFRCLENKLSRMGTGTTFKAITKDFLVNLEIPVPPLKEQHRIVAKIEELFSEIDKGVESLETAIAQLQVYRQALLKHAFEGKLTAQWRADNPDKVVPAEQLLEQIKQAREERYQQQLADWQKEVEKWEQGGKEGKKPSKPRKLKNYQPPDETVIKTLPGSPKGWVWEKLGWITLGVEYGTSAKSSKVGKIPVLRMGNIQNGKFEWDDLVYTSTKEEIKKYQLKAYDVLFNRTNSPELVGKTALYRGEQPAIFAGYLIRVNQMSEFVDADYLNYYLNSYVSKNYGNSVKTDGVNQSNINGEKLSNYPFPYCSVEEQKVIVAILDEKISECDNSLSIISNDIERAEGLRQSILKKAFSGQLVPQDPTDEPASKLLERIKAEKAEREAQAKANKIKKPRNRRKTKAAIP